MQINTKYDNGIYFIHEIDAIHAKNKQTSKYLCLNYLQIETQENICWLNIRNKMIDMETECVTSQRGRRSDFTVSFDIQMVVWKPGSYSSI